MNVVIDTNILVSSLLSKNGAPAMFISMVLSGRFIPCYDYRVIYEYSNVLSRKKFNLNKQNVASLLNFIITEGISIVPKTCNIDFIDEEDKKFYEVAKSCNAILVTGNIKHYPKDNTVMNVNDFIEKYSIL